MAWTKMTDSMLEPSKDSVASLQELLLLLQHPMLLWLPLSIPTHLCLPWPLTLLDLLPLYHPISAPCLPFLLPIPAFSIVPCILPPASSDPPHLSLLFAFEACLSTVPRVMSTLSLPDWMSSMSCSSTNKVDSLERLAVSSEPLCKSTLLSKETDRIWVSVTSRSFGAKSKITTPQWPLK